MWTLHSPDPLLVWIAAALMATLFAHAALSKLAEPQLFEQHLAAYGVPMHPAWLIAWLARALPALELLLAVLVLTPVRSLAAAGCAALLLSYALLMGWQRVQRRALDCGCGGQPLPISWLLVARNLGLAGIALLAAAAPAGRVLSLSDFAVLIASLGLGLLLYAAFNELLRHQVGRRVQTSVRSH